MSFFLNNLSCLYAEMPELQVKSPEWKDQIIYFLVTDRFNDGDKLNNDQGANEFDQSKNEKYSGGDIQGIIEKIPYLKKLGVTAIWITPVVANQWWDPWSNTSGYHGYWTENFKEVDKHLGNLQTYKALSSELHKNGMYLIQDVVCNHVGNFFRYNGTYDPADPTKNFELNMESKPSFRPTQYPFSINNVKDPKERAMNIYHWTPNISDYRNEKQKLVYQMSGLNDLNTSNKLVRDALKDSFSYWIKEVGVDAFRIDTATYVEHDFWRDFDPYIEKFAKKYGKNDFLMFAETWFNAEPYSQKGDLDSAKYLGTKKAPEFNSLINFPMQNDTERVFGKGAPTSLLTYRIKSLLKNYNNPYHLVNFIDNHDMSRFLASYGKNNFVQALTFILTIPGIPSIYYGTEQGYKVTRASMFKEGFASNGKDNFDTDSEYFNILSKLISLRKENSFFRNGKIKVLKDTNVDAGVFAYQMSNSFGKAIMIFNTASVPILMDNLKTNLSEGTEIEPIFVNNTDAKKMIIGKKGLVSSMLDPQSTMIMLVKDKKNNRENNNTQTISIMNFISGSKVNHNLKLKGKVTDINSDCKLYLIINGNFKEALPINTINGKEWKMTVPVDNIKDGTHEMVIAYVNRDNKICAISANYSFRILRPFKKVAEYKNKTGNDKGPNGTYLYPTDKTFNGQMDIEKVDIYRAGNNIKLAIKMTNPISTVWNPKNGFDHVVFAIYVGMPNSKSGATVMPFQNSILKDKMTWDYLAFIAAWNNAIYSNKNSSPNNFGTPVGPASDIQVDLKNRTINVVIQAKALGSPDNIDGSKIYITTWDYDGMESKYRPLTKKAQPFGFGGGDTDSPLIMDDTEVMVIFDTTAKKQDRNSSL